MEEQNYDLNQLYKGITPDFNEVEYLSKVSRLRYEFRKFMIAKEILYNDGLLYHNGKQKSYNHEINWFPNQHNRIDKNGSIAVEFFDGAPLNIYTPYGAIPIHDREYVGFNGGPLFLTEKAFRKKVF